MKNRAKCKICGDILESIHSQDYQLCRCGEIFIDGGKAMLCGARNWDNFLRIDDDGKEIVPKIIEKTENQQVIEEPKELNPDEKKQILLDHLKGMVDSFEKLPRVAHTSFVTQMDLHYALLTIYEIVRVL